MFIIDWLYLYLVGIFFSDFLTSFARVSLSFFFIYIKYLSKIILLTNIVNVELLYFAEINNTLKFSNKLLMINQGK
ncbi:hypothetical protein BpHYR1_048383 [Brachionus plicatilis]|uniref:Uncharacterized protein n=1 Tax=Brachionus plicatilis TaxID=10195 RepID=A0A3M7QF24_BRAPC|nr:hypothetical protein BpHYR1_048383 [Brachionus plicatilis]